MKKIIVAILGIATIGTIASCKKNDDSSPTTAKIMFMNGAINAPALDVTANNAKVSGATGLNFLNKSGYVDVTAGTSVSLAYLISSSSTNLTGASQSITAGKNYSAYAGGDAFSNPSFVFTADDLTAPPSGSAKVRFVHLSPSSLNESIFVGSVKIDSNITYKQVTPFIQVPAGPATVIIQDPQDPPHQVTMANQQFNSGKIYTIVLTGITTGTGTAVLTGTLVNNN
jgi:hypothetical protein